MLTDGRISNLRKKNDLSTPAVPMVINKILCASTLNVGNITRLSTAVQRASQLSADDKSSSTLRNIVLSDIHQFSIGKIKDFAAFCKICGNCNF
jgi:hypothetical protein